MHGTRSAEKLFCACLWKLAEAMQECKVSSQRKASPFKKKRGGRGVGVWESAGVGVRYDSPPLSCFCISSPPPNPCVFCTHVDEETEV